MSGLPPPPPLGDQSRAGEYAPWLAPSPTGTRRSRRLWGSSVVLVGLFVVEASLLVVGTLLPWRVVDGEADASLNGLYNFDSGSDHTSYLGPIVLFLAFVMLASSVATLVLAGLRSKGTRLAVALAAGLSVLLGIGVWRVADTNRRMVVDPGTTTSSGSRAGRRSDLVCK